MNATLQGESEESEALTCDSPPTGWQREWWECQGSLHKSWPALPQNVTLQRPMWIQRGFTHIRTSDVWTHHSVKRHWCLIVSVNHIESLLPSAITKCTVKRVQKIFSHFMVCNGTAVGQDSTQAHDMSPAACSYFVMMRLRVDSHDQQPYHKLEQGCGLTASMFLLQLRRSLIKLQVSESLCGKR